MKSFRINSTAILFLSLAFVLGACEADSNSPDEDKNTSSVVINELMPANSETIEDPQGDYDDWLELYNNSDSEYDLSGHYLTDEEEDLTKWEIPSGTVIPAGGYLIIWIDKDEGDTPGLHANFKLSADGEEVFLTKVQDGKETVVQEVEFPAMEDDKSYARQPNGSGDFIISDNPTPEAENTAG